MTHQGTSLPPLDELAVFSVNLTRAGKVKSVREFVHIGKPPRMVGNRVEPGIEGTGEIIPAERLDVLHLDLATLNADRRAAFDSLRPEVAEFATFVLMFRNNRRGITPGIVKLCQWYADLTGKRTDNVRRYIKPLRAAGILVGDDAVGRLWQKTGAKSKDVLGEEFTAWCRRMILAPRRFGANKALAERLTAEAIERAARSAEAAPSTAMALYAV